MRFREKYGMNTDINALLRITSDCKEFDDIAEIQTVFDVILRDVRDAFDGNIFESDYRIEGK